MAAIRDAHDNLEQLSHLVPVMDKYGEPYRSGGAFAVVFKMQDEQTGKCYALKCFTEEQEGRAEAYRQIAEELEFVDSSYITSVKYLENELFVDSSCDDDEFPWERQGDTLHTKYPYVCHAELNAILNNRAGSLENCRCYVTLFPCNECTKAIIQSGITQVVYISDKYAHTDASAASRKMFEAAGISLRKFVPATEKITISFREDDI